MTWLLVFFYLCHCPEKKLFLIILTMNLAQCFQRQTCFASRQTSHLSDSKHVGDVLEVTVSVSVSVFRLWDRTSMEEVKTLTFDTSVSSMEYVADGEILVITYGKTIAFYNALRYTAFILHVLYVHSDMKKMELLPGKVLGSISEQLNLFGWLNGFSIHVFQHCWHMEIFSQVCYRWQSHSKLVFPICITTWDCFQIDPLWKPSKALLCTPL